mgnify:CR=1 FL=1
MPQVTSPLRESSDIDNAIKKFRKEVFDSLLSKSLSEDLFYWESVSDGSIQSSNYDYKK